MIKSWKTTVVGTLAGFCQYMAMQPTKYQSMFQAGAGFFTFLLGVVSKDSNVTGGTKQV